MKGYKKALSVLLACTMIFMTACSAEDIEKMEKILAETDKGSDININFNSDKDSDATDEAGSGEVTSKDMQFYLCSEDDTRTQPVFFVGDSDVPYMSLEDWAELYPYLLKNYVHLGDEELEYGLSYTREGNVGTLSRTDGDPYTMTVDCDADTITFYDYDAFQRLEADRALIEILDADSSHSDEEISLFRRAPGSYERYGDPLVLDAGAYNIDLVADENGIYVA